MRGWRRCLHALPCCKQGGCACSAQLELKTCWACRPWHAVQSSHKRMSALGRVHASGTGEVALQGGGAENGVMITVDQHLHRMGVVDVDKTSRSTQTH